ncbi:MAG: DUF975 family protein [Clostridia bacterium]|nr:DUF975 family protein [Clostridia bacterium]
MVDNYLLRKNARMQLGDGIFHSKWLMALLVCAFASVVETALNGFPVLGTIASFLVTGAFIYGEARIMISNAQNGNWRFESIFDGFKEGFAKTLLLHFLQCLFVFFWAFLFVIPAIVKSYAYSMAFYLQQEYDGMSKEPNDLITESRKMMDGHKWQLFCLDFSFIGWYILGALCFGVGVLFVRPYHSQARANFYLALRAEQSVYHGYAFPQNGGFEE